MVSFGCLCTVHNMSEPGKTSGTIVSVDRSILRARSDVFLYCTVRGHLWRGGGRTAENKNRMDGECSESLRRWNFGEGSTVQHGGGRPSIDGMRRSCLMPWLRPEEMGGNNQPTFVNTFLQFSHSLITVNFVNIVS